MPIIKFNNRIFYYCHIPKCAGTSVEDYLMQSSCEVAFLDRNYFASKAALRKWCNTSPQHINGEFLAILFPEHFFDGFFAIVRDPIERFKSAFEHARSTSPLPPTRSINDFALNILPKNYNKVGWYDNHFLPQSSFIPPRRNCQLFSLSADGIVALKKYIEIEILKSPLEKDLPFKNKSTRKPQEINQKTMEIIRDIYSCDYELYNASLQGDIVNIDYAAEAEEIAFSGKIPYLFRSLVKRVELRLGPNRLKPGSRLNLK